MSEQITREDLAGELAAELFGISEWLRERRDGLVAEWDELSKPERHAAGSLATAIRHLNRAVEELDNEEL